MLKSHTICLSKSKSVNCKCNFCHMMSTFGASSHGSKHNPSSTITIEHKRPADNRYDELMKSMAILSAKQEALELQYTNLALEFKKLTEVYTVVMQERTQRSRSNAATGVRTVRRPN